ncbi:MAG: hypothetical protein V4671_09630 [Armatimonadota bacterium]
MILTLDIPEHLAEQLRAAAAAEGEDVNNYAVAKLQQGLAAGSEAEDPEVVAALQDVIEDYNKGERGRPVEEFMAELDAKYGPVPTSSKTK